MKRYNIRAEFTVDAETEEEALDLYSKGQAMFDAVYDVEEVMNYDEEDE
jgi:hypothetical protein